MSDQEAVRQSLLYLERTAHRLLTGTHPNPRRAAWLLTVHAQRVGFLVHEIPPGGYDE